MSTNETSSDHLRDVVREVLREVLASRAPGSEPPAKAAEHVRIANDADLARFVARIIQHLDNPATAGGLCSGQHTFTLEETRVSAPAPFNGTILAGVITEAKIEKHAAGGVVAVAPDAVITPLARDKASKLGVKIERRRLC